MAITRLFRCVRKLSRMALFLRDGSHPPSRRSSEDATPHPRPRRKSLQRCHSAVEGPSTGHEMMRTASTPVIPSHSLLDPGPITAEHFIEEAGYPRESHAVTTDDGYILSLHRLPRPNAVRTVFFQHGVLDTSLGWVCSGVTDSLAFSAWDQGCDVWLGNMRSNPPRRHTNPHIAHDAYWSYSLNELGIKDVGAQIEYIHAVKCQELEDRDLDGDTWMAFPDDNWLDVDSIDPPLEDDGGPLPYSLSVVGHSLGAAALLIYLVTCLHEQKRHCVQRMILMSPAGFHPTYPLLLAPIRWILPPIAWFVERVLKRRGTALIIPGAFTRLVLFKILQDAVQYPAIREFTRRGIRWLMNGDVSPWDSVMQLPHYDVASMPGIALHAGMHFVQLVRTQRFRLFDYGSPEANLVQYGRSEPLDLAREYWRIDIPVDIVAGRNDGVIPPECVRLHVAHMKEKGVEVSYNEFEYGHLEFSATVAHDLQSYILERLLK